MKKRLAIALLTAFAVGFLLDYFQSGGIHVDTTTNLMRFAVAFFITIAGVITHHPLFGFRMFLVRGIAIGALLALVAYGTGDMVATLISGAALGLLVDVTATKFGGEGKRLLHSRNL